MFQMCLLAQATPALVFRLMKNDRAQSLKILTTMTACTSGVEFLLQQFQGALSDAHGRKPFLVAGALMSLIWRGRVARDASLFNISVGRVLSGSMFSLFNASLSAAAADLCNGDSKSVPASPTPPTRPTFAPRPTSTLHADPRLTLLPPLLR